MSKQTLSINPDKIVSYAELAAAIEITNQNLAETEKIKQEINSRLNNVHAAIKSGEKTVQTAAEVVRYHKKTTEQMTGVILSLQKLQTTIIKTIKDAEEQNNEQKTLMERLQDNIYFVAAGLGAGITISILISQLMK